MSTQHPRGPVPQHASAITDRDTACHIGVRIDGVDMSKTVVAYNVKEGWARIGRAGQTGVVRIKGKIEPYWRS